MAMSTNQFGPGLNDIYGLEKMQRAVSEQEYKMEMMRRKYLNMPPPEYAAQEQPAKKQVNKTLLLLEI